MKKILIVLLALSILAFAGVVIAGVGADKGISGTPHAISGGEPCAYCHTPHVPGSATPTYPLWNRSQTGITYTAYSSASFDMRGLTNPTQAQVDASTRACMQCHNGQASGLVNYPGRGVNSGAVYDIDSGDFAALGNLGTDLNQEHPVAFDYDPTDDNGTENNGFPTMSGGKVDGLPFYDLSGKVTGATGMMGCGTCHEPHDTYTYDGKDSVGAGTQVFFLRNATSAGNNGNAGSAMCKACHTNRY